MAKSDRKNRRGGLAGRKWLSERQVQQLLNYLRCRAEKGSHRAAVNELIVVMLLYSGLRAQELLSLKIQDCPCSHGKDVIEVIEGKGGIDRTVSVPDWLNQLIGNFVRKHRKGAKPGSPLIPSETGVRRIVIKKTRKHRGSVKVTVTAERSCRMTYRAFWERIKTMGINSGLGRLTPHMVRHTYAIRLYNVAQDIRLVQDQLGHEHLDTTSIYARTSNRRRQEQIQALPPVLFDGNLNSL